MSNENSIDTSSLFMFTLLRFYISTSLTMLDRPDFAIAFSIALCSMSNNNSLVNLWFSSANISNSISNLQVTHTVLSVSIQNQYPVSITSSTTKPLNPTSLRGWTHSIPFVIAVSILSIILKISYWSNKLVQS